MGYQAQNFAQVENTELKKNRSQPSKDERTTCSLSNGFMAQGMGEKGINWGRFRNNKGNYG